MKPAICPVCNTSSMQSPKGEWVTFLDYNRLDEEEIGHPEGLEWFCANHLSEAKLLSGKNVADAIEELQNKHPVTKNFNTDDEKKPWWQRLMRG
jgi:hypothetical protein